MKNIKLSYIQFVSTYFSNNFVIAKMRWVKNEVGENSKREVDE